MTFTRLILKLMFPALLLCVLFMGVMLILGQNADSWDIIYVTRGRNSTETALLRVDGYRGLSYRFFQSQINPTGIGISPNNRFLVWMTGVGGAIMYDLQDGDFTGIDTSISPLWSTGHDYIVYQSASGIFTSRVDVDGGIMDTNRITGATGSISSPSWSPTGRYLTMLERKNDTVTAYLLDVYSGNVFYPLNSDLGTFGLLSWSPDGTQIAFTTLQDDVVHVYRVDIPLDGDISDLSPQLISRLSSRVGTLAWSPDGTQVAYTSLAEDSISYQVTLINPASGDARILASHQQRVMHMQWSPDGTRLAVEFSQSGVRAGNDLYVLDVVDTIPVLRLVFADIDGTVIWSPDSRRLMVVSRVNNALYVVHADGSGIMQVSEASHFIEVIR